MLMPVVAELPAQPYVAIRAQVTMQTMDAILLPLQPQVFAWLRARDIPAAGPPFWKFNVIDMDGFLEVEVGAPVTAPVDADGRVLAGVLPAGRYATLRYTGHPDGLIGVIASFGEWATREGLTWDMTDAPDGERWGARLEIHETDPADEPDMTKWTTQLAFRLAGLPIP
jgi:effector-binding domain-containing protein